MVKRGLGIIFLFVFGVLLTISISNFVSAAACSPGTYGCTCKCGPNDGDLCDFDADCGTGYYCTNAYWTTCGTTYCGNSICETGETCATCAGDCNCPSCPWYCSNTCGGIPINGACESSPRGVIYTSVQCSNFYVGVFYFPAYGSGCWNSGYCVCEHLCGGDSDCPDRTTCSDTTLKTENWWCRPGHSCELLSNTSTSCGTTSCNSALHWTGSCSNFCGSGVCNVCTPPSCTCSDGWCNANGLPGDGCEAPLETNLAFCQRLGKNCGSVTGTDNCGNSRTINCGTCSAGQTCDETGTCASCMDTCSSLGYNCGVHTICGVGTNCGTCSGGQTCNSTGQCATICTDTCPSLGYNCGVHTICEVSINCGTCSAGDSCDSRGICVPDCTDTCSALGYNCGTQTVCGVSTNCGSCSAGDSCNSLGVCVPNCVDTCSSLGYVCGVHTICGVSTNCGSTCPIGQTCNSLGKCVVNCTDTCSSLGYNCGTQTICEVSTNCGTCSAGSECYLGTCVPSCVLSNLVWNVTNAVKGQKVEARVQGTSSCNGQVVSFEVREDDLIGYDAVQTNPVNFTMSSGLAIGTWTAEWPGLGNNEEILEYYFIANINSLGKMEVSSRVSANELKVIEKDDGVCAGINYCRDYSKNDVAGCAADPCGIAKASVQSINPSITCGIGYNCGCEWDNSKSPKCNPKWDGTRDCGNKIKNFGEQCDDGNVVSGDGCSSTCQYECNLIAPCSVGTTLCSDGTCSLNCGFCDEGTTCDYDTTCDAGEGCTCSDCDGKLDTCETGLLCSLDDNACCKSEADGTCDNYCSFVDPDCTGECGNGIEETGEQCDDENIIFGDGCSSTCQYECGLTSPCPVGTTLCSDGTCSLNCGFCDNSTKCDYDSVCETGEGCTCKDCNGKIDTCKAGLLCSLDDGACCKSTADGVCNRYCAFIDPDCKTEPSLGVIGNCTYTENSQDTCEDDNMLTRSIDAVWTWATWNVPPNYYDPLDKHSKCANINDVIPCPPSVQVSFFGIYSFVGVIVLVVLIYLLYSLKKKNSRKSNSKKRRERKK